MGRIIDVKPKAGVFLSDKPTVGSMRRATEDSSALTPRTLGRGSPFGPGWFMFVTYSADEVIYA